MKLVRFPDKLLKLRSLELVDKVTNVTEATINEMFKAMDAWNGIGLSAIQIGYPFRVFVMDTSPMGSNVGPLTIINPEILETSTESVDTMEGCLSFPGVGVVVTRPQQLLVKFRDRDFQEVTRELSGIDAVCFQHELDHLDGITLYDKAKPLKREQIRKKLGTPA